MNSIEPSRFGNVSEVLVLCLFPHMCGRSVNVRRSVTHNYKKNHHDERKAIDEWSIKIIAQSWKRQRSFLSFPATYLADAWMSGDSQWKKSSQRKRSGWWILLGSRGLETTELFVAREGWWPSEARGAEQCEAPRAEGRPDNRSAACGSLNSSISANIAKQDLSSPARGWNGPSLSPIIGEITLLIDRDIWKRRRSFLSFQATCLADKWMSRNSQWKKSSQSKRGCRLIHGPIVVIVLNVNTFSINIRYNLQILRTFFFYFFWGVFFCRFCVCFDVAWVWGLESKGFERKKEAAEREEVDWIGDLMWFGKNGNCGSVLVVRRLFGEME